MEARLNPQKASPEIYKAMFALETAVKATGLESNLLDLVKLRASQINGCAFCIDMHSKDLRGRRNRAAALPLGRMARGAVLLRPRAGRAGVDGGRDADHRGACAG